MKRLSPRAEALVSQLERAPDPMGKFTGLATQDLADILLALEACGEIGVLPHVLSFVFGSNGDVSRTSARIVANVIEGATPVELLELNDVCRAQSMYQSRWAGAWGALRPVIISQFGTPSHDMVSLLGIASFHGNGFVREVAVRQLDAITTGAELPFLLIRLNDWARPVAKRAAIAVRRRLTVQFAHEFVKNLPILRRLEVSRRHDHRTILDAVFTLLKEADCQLALESGLGMADVDSRRLLFRVAREGSAIDPARLLARALLDADTVIRLDAVKAAHHSTSVEALRAALPRILADPLPRIRVEGIVIAADRLGADAQSILLAAMIDRSRSVREIARFHLGRRGGHEDFAEFYRRRVAFASAHDAVPLAVAIAGLGETGTVTDTPSLSKCLDDARPSVRKASVRAIGDLGVGPELASVVRMLRDPSPAVSHAARAVLRPRAAQVGVDALMSILRDYPLAHSRLDALSIGTMLGKWESLAMLLEVAADNDQKTRDAAHLWLRRWLDRRNWSGAQPSRDQLNAIRTLLAARQDVLDADIIGELRASYRSWDEQSTPMPK